MLTEAIILEAKPADKPYKLFDARGLFILIVPQGGKWWRFRYRFGGVEKSISLGIYPEVNLEAARRSQDKARQLLASGLDPAAIRREQKAREKTERLAEKDSARVRVSAALDGAVEIWKGRSVLRLTASEATSVKDLLIRLSE